jgi:flavin-dependent dehydrogenase
MRGAGEAMKDVDVVVVGAGPAGAASAILLAERGWSVTLLDKAAFPRPKICGEYLSPEAARVLDRLAVLKAVDQAGAQPLRGMKIVAPDGTALEGLYPTSGPWRGYRDHALAIPREVLDRILVDRARGLPVDVLERHRVTGLLHEAGSVAGVTAQDEDGLARRHRLRRMALIQYVSGLKGIQDRGEIYLDPPDYAILNPVAPGLVNLGLVVPLGHARPFARRLETFFGARLRQLRHLAPRLDSMRAEGRLTAMGPLAYKVAEPQVGGVMLVGDATGFYDPFTGEGIFTALRSAELLTETAHAALTRDDLSVGPLAVYGERRRAELAAKSRVTRGLQLLISRRRLSNLAARLLARRPHLVHTLLGVFGDFVPPRELLRAAFSRRV